MSRELENIEFSLLWPTPILQSRFAGNLDEMRQEVYRLHAMPDGTGKSNHGGWQSDVHLQDNPVFLPLCNGLGSICAQVFKVKGAKVHRMWACIDKKGDQNPIRSHTNNYNLSGLCHLSAPGDCGEIVFRDPRPGASQAPRKLFKDDGDSDYFMPSEGQILLFPSYLEHFVLPNRSDSDRVSIRFDLTLERQELR